MTWTHWKTAGSFCFTWSDTSCFVRLALNILERSLRRARYINRVIMSSLRGRGVYLWVRHYRSIGVSRGLLFRWDNFGFLSCRLLINGYFSQFWAVLCFVPSYFWMDKYCLGGFSCCSDLLARVELCHTVYVLYIGQLLCSDSSGGEIGRFRVCLWMPMELS